MAWTTIEAKYEECAYWIARLLAHFPNRETTKDGIIIADLSSACVEEKASLLAVSQICDETWKAATQKNPWMPPTGDILERIKDKTKFWHATLDRLANPKIMITAQTKQKDPDPYGGRKWNEFTDEDRERFFSEAKQYDEKFQRFFRSIFDVPDDVIIPEE